ncbi:MAG: hypothetical protein COS89_06765, partial [Deltaproteobacteria bacterium CG07_land_8_20_14_0_80_38_7]
MANYSEEQRGTSGSLLGSFFNPITQMKYQYFSKWSIPTYMSMMKGGQIPVSLFYMGKFIPGMKHLVAAPGSDAPMWKKFVGSIIDYSYNPIQSLQDNIAGAAVKSGLDENVIHAFRSKFNKAATELVKKSKFKSIPSGDIKNLLGGLLGPGQADKAMVTSAATMLNRAQVIMRVGGLTTGILTGMTIGSGIAGMAALAFKGAMATMNYLDSAMEHIRGLEFGGTLGPGYRTGAAATERQRSISELQRSPIAGRRFLGSEAKMYAGL